MKMVFTLEEVLHILEKIVITEFDTHEQLAKTEAFFSRYEDTFTVNMEGQQ
jgi:hypothetical protein